VWQLFRQWFIWGGKQRMKCVESLWNESEILLRPSWRHWLLILPS